MRLASLLFCFFLALTNTFVPVVLRGKCLSVDEPILGSTPVLAILGSLTTLSPKYSLTISGVCTIAAVVSCADLHLLPGDKAKENDDFKKSRTIDLRPTPLIKSTLWVSRRASHG